MTGGTPGGTGGGMTGGTAGATGGIGGTVSPQADMTAPLDFTNILQFGQTYYPTFDYNTQAR
jgi:hypothetical protein